MSDTPASPLLPAPAAVQALADNLIPALSRGTFFEVLRRHKASLLTRQVAHALLLVDQAGHEVPVECWSWVFGPGCEDLLTAWRTAGPRSTTWLEYLAEQLGHVADFDSQAEEAEAQFRRAAEARLVGRIMRPYWNLPSLIVTERAQRMGKQPIRLWRCELACADVPPERLREIVAAYWSPTVRGSLLAHPALPRELRPVVLADRNWLPSELAIGLRRHRALLDDPDFLAEAHRALSTNFARYEETREDAGRLATALAERTTDPAQWTLAVRYLLAEWPLEGVAALTARPDLARAHIAATELAPLFTDTEDSIRQAALRGLAVVAAPGEPVSPTEKDTPRMAQLPVWRR